MSLSVDSLLAQHVRILNAAAALEHLSAEQAPLSAHLLNHARWVLARDVLLHLGDIEAQLYDRFPDAGRAAAAIADADALVAAIRSYVEHWHAVPVMEARAEHRAAAADLTAAIRTRLDQEAHDIVTLLPTLSPAPANPPTRNGYAAEAWRLRLILLERGPLPPA